jgi:hypothetical protein
MKGETISEVRKTVSVRGNEIQLGCEKSDSRLTDGSVVVSLALSPE